ncbi:MAG: NAD-dependent epimerase/dehydratase family protein [Frankiales bacterium]|nr:NAD-dependent epimerase/dehydratase family protein [Frankiales bacterium]
MRVLVTGGAGFIGSHVVDLLVADGHDVVSLDSVSPAAHAVEPDYLHHGAEHRRARVGDLDAVLDAVRGADAVCHQAARVGLGVDFGDVRHYVEDNALGTATLLEAMHRNGFRGRLVQASSMVVYGEGAYDCPRHGRVVPAPRRRQDLDRGMFEPPCPTCGAPLTPALVTEDARTDPRNVYAATKLHQEHLAAAYADATGADVVSLRYHNVYGPRMPRETPYAGVASIVRSACERGEAPRVFEDGGQRRDFVHVHDVARANVLALTAPGRVGGAFNIASGHVCTVREMAEAVAAGCGPGAPAPVVTGEHRVGDVRHVTASPARAAEAFGFRALVAPAEGFRRFATDPMRAPLRRDVTGGTVASRAG